jgi:hypothetical protein
MISLLAGSANEEASSPKTSPSASDHEWDGLRRSPSGSVCSTSSPRRVVDVTLTAWNEVNENGLPPFSAPSPASAYSRSSYVEVGSPLMLPQSPRLVSSASTISTSSSNGAPSVLVCAKHFHFCLCLYIYIYCRKMTELKSNKAKYVREHAPISCHIQFICKDRLIFTRFGRRTVFVNYSFFKQP